MSASCMPPLQIPIMSPPKSEPVHTTIPSQVGSLSQFTRQRLVMVLISLIVLVMIIIELVVNRHQALDLLFWVVTLVFPSHDITWMKIMCVTVGICLSSSYFLSSPSQLATAEYVIMHSAQSIVSPFSRSQRNSEIISIPVVTNPRKSTDTTSASWITSCCQSFCTNHFVDDAGSIELDEVPHLKVRDECQAARETQMPPPLQMVNGKLPIPFESEYFAGQVLFMVNTVNEQTHSAQSNWGHLFANKKRMLWVQVQGQFRKLPPEKSAIFIATELPKPDGFQVAFLTKQLVMLLITLVKKFVPSAHISFGEKSMDPTEHELPHAAFPLYQTVDEYVVTETPGEGTRTEVPRLGQKSFGESPEQKKARQTTMIGKEPPVRLNAIYTFQFYTMYADLAQWKVVNVPSMPDMHLSRFCGTQPIQLASYFVSVPLNHPIVLPTRPHKHKHKNYLFCFSMNPIQTQIASPTKESWIKPLSSTTNQDQSDTKDKLSVSSCQEVNVPLSLTSTSPGTKPQVPIDQPRIRAPSLIRKMTAMERAQDLENWSFSLPLWIECVDAAAGKRKISYLFTVQLKDPSRHASHHHRQRCVIRSAATLKSALLLLPSREQNTEKGFRKLMTESREFQYTIISKETQLVHEYLQQLACCPTTEQTFEEKAMLYNCLMSEAELSCIRTFSSIGIQFSSAKREQMDIIYEKGIYRMISINDHQLLRQEWFVLTTRDLLFYRSFTLRPCKTIPITHVLSVESVDNIPFLNADTSSSTAPRIATNRWFCIQVHLLTEVMTVFVDNEADRMLWIKSLNQLIKLHSTNPCSSRMMTMDSLTSQICLNHRNPFEAYSHAMESSKMKNGLELVEEILRRGLAVFNSSRLELKSNCLLAFINAVEWLNNLDLDQSKTWLDTDDAKIAFVLNLYHILCIHTWIIYGDITNQIQWKKVKSLPYYSIGPLRITLAELEYVALGGTIAPGEDCIVSDQNRTEFQRLIPKQRDFRTTFALHLNSCRSLDNGHLIRVYHGHEDVDDPRTNLNSELNETCAKFLENDVVIDDKSRTILLPKLCEVNAKDYENQGTVSSKGFYSLQKLIPLMHTEQQAHVQHLLLGAGNQATIKYNTRFWTQTIV